MNSLDKFERDVLNFITYHTHHVLHPDGGPARLPLRIIVANFPDNRLQKTLANLKTRKFITDYIWNTDYNTGLRATTKGCTNSTAVFKIPGGKRVLEIDGNNLRLIPYREWYGNGIIYTEGGIVHK